MKLKNRLYHHLLMNRHYCRALALRDRLTRVLLKPNFPGWEAFRSFLHRREHVCSTLWEATMPHPLPVWIDVDPDYPQSWARNTLGFQRYGDFFSYDIDLDQIETTEDLLGWVVSLLGEDWIPKKCIAEFASKVAELKGIELKLNGKYFDETLA